MLHVLTHSFSQLSSELDCCLAAKEAEAQE